MQTHKIVDSKSQTQVKEPQVWDKPTALAQVGDEIQIPFTPVMQVVDREVLADGRVRLLVKPASASYSEEWIVEPEPIVEQQPTSVPSEDIEAAQPVDFAGDVTSCQLSSGGEAIAPWGNVNAEYESGCTHGKFDAASRMPPICTQASCPYSQGYLDGYSNFLASQQRSLPASKSIEWSVVHDPKWDVYQVWIGDRCLQQKAISYEEGEKIAQNYLAAEELRRQHRELVLAAFAS